MQINNDLIHKEIWEKVLPATSMEQFVAALETDPFGLEVQGLFPELKLNHQDVRREENFQCLNINLSYFRKDIANPDYQLTLLMMDSGRQPSAKLLGCFNDTGKTRTGYGRKALALVADLILHNHYDRLVADATLDGIFAWPRMRARMDSATIDGVGRLLYNQGEAEILTHPDFDEGLWGDLLRLQPQDENALARALINFESILGKGQYMQVSWNADALDAARTTVYENGGPFSAEISPTRGLQPGRHFEQQLVKF